MEKTLRDVYGEALLKYGAENQKVVVLDADVSSSTKSSIFGKAYPERFFNTGICENAMVSMAGGMAINGKIPFVNTFAVFLSTIGLLGARMFLSYSDLNIKLMGAYGGLSDSYDGASHQSLEDVAAMRNLPGVTVMVASDELITDWMVKTAIDTVGPMYIRLTRNAVPICHKENTNYQIGKGIVVKDGTDVTVIACGTMVFEALEAAEKLKEKNIRVKVIDMFTIKPIDQELIIKSAKETGAIVTVEEHSVIGGLGSAVAEVLVAEGMNAPVEMVGTKDCHGCSGTYDEILKKYGLDSTSIAEAAERVVNRKKESK